MRARQLNPITDPNAKGIEAYERSHRQHSRLKRMEEGRSRGSKLLTHEIAPKKYAFVVDSGLEAIARCQ